MADLLTARRVGLWLFMVTAVVFLSSPIWDLSDARYSMLLSESIIRNHSVYMNGYQFPGPIRESGRCESPSVPLQSAFLTYQLDRVSGNVVYCYPNGSSILSIPFVGLMNVLGVHCYSQDGRYLPLGEGIMQRILAALLMAGFTVVVFNTALQMLGVGPSLIVAAGTAFGTQIWSTASRIMWSHTWLIFLGGLAAYYLLGRETGRTKRAHPIALATLLSWMYFARPTGAIPIICITVYTFLFCRIGFIYYALTGLAWFGGFAAYSWFTFGKLIPDYYLDSRVSIDSIATTLPAILISPSRGLFIFVPALIFVFYLLIRYRRAVPYPRLAILSLSIVAIQTMLVALWPVWWGGYSYGPRLLADAIPWLALLAILGCAARLRSANNAKFSRAEIAIALSLLALSIAINGRGAISAAPVTWNVEVDIDRHPERVWNWSNPQFMAGLP
ncbi:MAG: hypothetical protein WA993_04365 [Candidatus Binatus sp.]